jgi:COP9 signalosome complex subunit 3
LIELQVIHPTLNTVSYTYILLAHISVVEKGNRNIDPSALWEWSANFLGSFDPRQIRYLGKELYQVTDFVALCARRSRQVRLFTLGI